MRWVKFSCYGVDWEELDWFSWDGLNWFSYVDWVFWMICLVELEFFSNDLFGWVRVMLIELGWDELNWDELDFLNEFICYVDWIRLRWVKLRWVEMG